MKIAYSEIFRSIQGEGAHTGRNTLWLRLWGCNLSCKGFMQPDPTNPETYIDPWAKIDFKTLTKLEDLPVLHVGCDSSYSHEPEFLKLVKRKTDVEISDALINLMRSPSNPEGKFKHPATKVATHMCFTGGEPLMNQKGVVAVIDALLAQDNMPEHVTFETNGMYVIGVQLANKLVDTHVTLSISPKLFTVSGEVDALRPGVVDTLLDQANNMEWQSQLKFVITNEERAWREMEDFIDALTEVPTEGIWIMPVGGTEAQQLSDTTRHIIEQAIDSGYNVAARVHALIWSNSVGK